MSSTTVSKRMRNEPGSGRAAGQRVKFLAVWLPVLVLIFAANHLEYYFRMRSVEERSKKTGAVIVRAEGGSLGHSTIGVDESSIVSGGDRTFLHFSTLSIWEFDPDKPTPCPDAIKELSSRTVTCIGFMYPLAAGSEIRLFSLLRATQTCCYGPRPQFNQYIFVEMKEPVKFERLRPIVVEGVFFVDPKPDEGYIYRLEATSAHAVSDDVPDVDAAEAAGEVGLALFDFTLLGNMKSRGDGGGGSGIPRELRMLEGSKVVLEGFLVGSTKDSPPTQIVGKYWWDGVMKGTPPDLYNAVMVFPKDESQVPPAWKQKVVFTGTLRITEDESLYPDNGIVSIREAVRGVPGQNGIGGLFNAGPFLSVWHEAVILGAFFILTLRKPGLLGK